MPESQHNCEDKRLEATGSGTGDEFQILASESRQSHVQHPINQGPEHHGDCLGRTTMKRILLADDHALMLEGLLRLLSGHFEVVGTAPNGRVLVEEAKRLNPDAVVLDITMPELNGIEAAMRLRSLVPAAKVIFVSQQLDPAYLHAAFTAGAMGYVAKQSATTELVKAIQMALNGRYYVTPLANRELAEIASLNSRKNPAHMFGSELTPRQREVLQLVAEGKSTKEISAALQISAKTVEFHRNNLMDELGVRSIAELTRIAVSRGIIGT
jgi:DNA-binding NarL/FixJ family response regulator